MRRLGLALACLLLALPVADAAALTPDGKVVVVDIDTGINAAHQEFAADQLVGFFDFSAGAVPQPGQLFDPKVAPFDPNGHGTATSSMIGSLGVSKEQTPSAAPGVKLAMAKVGDDDGAISGSLEDAIHWAIDTVHADAINMSIGVIAPVGPAQSVISQATFDAIREARAHGILFTVSNGNGAGNTGLVPGDGASTPYGSSLDVLSVGAEGVDGLTVAYNPEVAAVYAVRAPKNEGHDGYTDTAGTSFASPFVNGFAARLITELVATGRTMPVTALEQLIKNVADDTDIPPSSEGYGVVGLDQLPSALTALGAAVTPRDDMSAQYVEEVAGAERKLNNGYDPSAAYDDPGAKANVASAGGSATAPASGTTTAPSQSSPSPSSPGNPGAPGSPGSTPASGTTAGPAAPTLSSLRRVGRRRLRVLVNQRVTLRVKLRRAGHRAKRRTLRFRGPGTVTLRLGKLRRGRYVAVVRAVSELGAPSTTKRLRFRVR